MKFFLVFPQKTLVIINKMKHLYFFHNPINNSVKIGRSSNVDERLKTIRYQSGVPEIELSLCYHNNGRLEPDLHRLFIKYRTIGEWFSLDGTLKLYYEYLLNDYFEINYLDFAYLCVIEDINYFKQLNLNNNFTKIKNEIEPVINSVIEIREALGQGTNGEIKTTGFLWEFIRKSKTNVLTICKNGESYLEEHLLNFHSNLRYSLEEWN